MLTDAQFAALVEVVRDEGRASIGGAVRSRDGLPMADTLRALVLDLLVTAGAPSAFFRDVIEAHGRAMGAALAKAEAERRA